MPPAKGKQRATNTKPRQRLTKAAKANNITNEQEELICEAFQLFALQGIEGYDDEEYGVLKVQDIKRVLSALEIDPSTTPTARNDLDPEFTGYVTYSTFLPYASTHINLGSSGSQDEDDVEAEHMKEVQSAFDLFTHNGPGPISIAHLRRVARQLKEEVSDEQLANMIRVANGREEKSGWQAGVTMGEFEKVLGEAGAWKR